MSWAYQPLLPASAEQQAAGAGATYTIAADNGALALDGEAAGPRAARRVAISAGAAALTGQAAVGAASRRAAAAAGSLALAGQIVAFASAPVLAASPASIALGGTGVLFAFARKLAAAEGAILLTGQAAQFNAPSATMAAGAGNFTLAAPAAASLTTARRPHVQPGLFTVAGGAVGTPNPAATPSNTLDIGLSIGI